MQHALNVASIAGAILLIFILVWLIYDFIAEYSARRRFAKLRALRNFWLRDLDRVINQRSSKGE
jgi:hypothetical protein